MVLILGAGSIFTAPPVCHRIYLKNKLPQTILLSGEKGIGKSTLAYHLINLVLSENEEHPYDFENNKISLNYARGNNLEVENKIDDLMQKKLEELESVKK